jgi:hypothetical protein
MLQRYLIASGVFAAAALVFGVGLAHGFECLAAFALTSLIVGGVQRRQLVNERSRARGRRRPAVAERGRRAPSRHREPRVTRDGAAKSGDWPQLADYGW